MKRPARILFVSNGHGEDDIACKVLDELRAAAGDPPPEIAAWPMVGQGRAYAARGVEVVGPEGALPSEGFSTLSLRHFRRDIAGGWPRLLFRQWRFARAIRGRHDLLVGTGDVVPLLAAWVARTPMGFIACAKSSFYGPAYDNNLIERRLMRWRCPDIFPRDEPTSERLERAGLPSRYLGNPMMDGLEPTDPEGLRAGAPAAVALLPGSRRDATGNARLLIAAAGHAAAAPGAAPGTRYLLAAHDAVDFATLARDAPEPWLRAAPPSGAGGDGAGHAAVMLTHPAGAELLAVKGRFADVLHAADLAVGMAGTANEQAVGLGLPLIAVPGQGNQGAAFVRMKMRYFGDAAVAAEPEAGAVGAAVAALLADPARRARMAAEGQRRMGKPGASRAIAAAILARLQTFAAERAP